MNQYGYLPVNFSYSWTQNVSSLLFMTDSECTKLIDISSDNRMIWNTRNKAYHFTAYWICQNIFLEVWKEVLHYVSGWWQRDQEAISWVHSLVFSSTQPILVLLLFFLKKMSWNILIIQEELASNPKGDPIVFAYIGIDFKISQVSLWRMVVSGRQAGLTPHVILRHMLLEGRLEGGNGWRKFTYKVAFTLTTKEKHILRDVWLEETSLHRANLNTPNNKRPTLVKSLKFTKQVQARSGTNNSADLIQTILCDTPHS